MVGLVLAVTAVTHGSGMTVYNYTICPCDLADGAAFANGQGGEPFGYDHGPDPPQDPPIGVYVAGPTGWGQSSWWSNVQGSLAGGGRDYTSFRMSPKDIFHVEDVTYGDLIYFSYWTKSMDTSQIDWRFTIYTEGTQTGNWYGHRIEYNHPDNPNNDWTLQTMGDLGINNIAGKPGEGDLLATDKILFIDILAGYATDSPAVDSYLDGVELQLLSGDIAYIDLAVPEPLTMLGMFLGLGSVGAYIRRRIRS